ncbi:hypothetical protein JCM8208_000752 [Rhodotorula glutinis]
MSASTSINCVPATPQPQQVALIPASLSTAANSLPDELLDKIFSRLVALDSKQHPLYYVCLASRKFRRIAQPLLWEVVAFEVDSDSGGDGFVEAAQQFGHYTRDVSVVFSRWADDEAYTAYTPALKHMLGARRIQVVHNAASEALRFQPVDLFANIESTNLEHVGVLHLPRHSGLPRVSSLRTSTSLDLVGSGGAGLLEHLYETPGLMPSLRALAADVWWSPSIGARDDLFAQLDMFQDHVESAWLVNAPHDKVPFLADFVLSAGDRPTSFNALARHVSIVRIFSGSAPGGNTSLSASLDNLSTSIKAGAVKSLWLPHDPTSVGSPRGDAEVEAAWDRLCAAARTANLPGRLVGDGKDPRALPGGRLDFGFWRYARGLRAAGEV